MSPIDPQHKRLAGGAGPPGCSPDPPQVDSPPDVLRWLLWIEIERLHTAVRIEAERSIVFPETTVIIRDIQKLMAALCNEEPTRGSQTPSTRLSDDDELSRILSDLSD
jgi:hypothetical protein